MEHDIIEIIRPSVEHLGFRLVRVKMMDASGRKVLQVMIERIDGVGINVDDCANISHTVSALLDVNDTVKYEYNLEVTSPGVDRPLMSLQDFERFKGFEAKIETMIMVAGRKRWRGILQGIEGDEVIIKVDGVDCNVPFARIGNAKLILNDDLLKAHAEGRLTH